MYCHCEPCVFYKVWQSRDLTWIASKTALAMTVLLLYLPRKRILLAAGFSLCFFKELQAKVCGYYFSATNFLYRLTIQISTI